VAAQPVEEPDPEEDSTVDVLDLADMLMEELMLTVVALELLACLI